MEMKKISLKRKRGRFNRNRGSEMKMSRCETFISRMPEEIILEVLLRLPVRDVHRSKCVCKQWLSIITCPDFLEAYSSRKHEPCHGIFIATADDEAREFVFYYSSLLEDDDDEHHKTMMTDMKRKMMTTMCPPPPPPRVFVPRFRVSYSDYQWMTQVVNGLVCVYSSNRLTLVSLCTGDTVDLPLPPLPPLNAFTKVKYYECRRTPKISEEDFSHIPGADKAVNRTAIHYYFGFDVVHDVYKVLSVSYMCRARCRGPGDTCRCPCFFVPHILTLSGPKSSFHWREVPYPRPNDKFDTQSFFSDGHLYWMCGIKTNLRRKRIPKPMAYCFDFNYEYFSCVFFAPELPDSYKFYLRSKISHHGRSLALLDCYSSKETLHIYVFVDVTRWDKHSISLPHELLGNALHNVTPVGSLPTGDMLLANNRATEFYTPVYSYNYEKKSFKRFVVGKFPQSRASMSPIDSAICTTCVEEHLTPLRVLIGAS